MLIRLWQAFRVHWRDEGSRVDTAAYTTLDGYKGETSRGGIRTGPNTERPFTFANFDEGSQFLMPPHSVSKGTWNNRASRPAHLLDPSW
ncbi:hypothetical protein EI94DRAFT_1713258 [Lactarius quietus]|nr:hypothetical protein EI94DRAFT_1713258 [Lactarius quietus]